MHHLTYKGEIFTWEITEPDLVVHVYDSTGTVVGLYTGDPHDRTREGVIRELKERGRVK